MCNFQKVNIPFFRANNNPDQMLSSAVFNTGLHVHVYYMYLQWSRYGHRAWMQWGKCFMGHLISFPTNGQNLLPGNKFPLILIILTPTNSLLSFMSNLPLGPKFFFYIFMYICSTYMYMYFNLLSTRPFYYLDHEFWSLVELFSVFEYCLTCTWAHDRIKNWIQWKWIMALNDM